MINLREHLKLTGIYTFFAAFPAILQLIVYPIIEGTNRLGAEDFGYLAITEAIISFMVIFCLFGMSVTISRFYYDYNEKTKEYKSLVSSVFIGIILRGIVLFGIVFLFADTLSSFLSPQPLKEVNQYGFLLPIISLNRVLASVSLALFRNEKKIKIFIIISLLSGLARSLFQIIGVLYFDLSFIGYLEGTALGGGFATLLILIYTFSKNSITFSKRISFNTFKYAFPFFLSDILFWGIVFIDRFLLMRTPGQLGIYDNALKFAMGFYFISQGLANSTQPELYRYFKEGIKKRESMIKSLSNLFIVENIGTAVIILVPLMIFINLFYETELVMSSSILTLVFLKYILNAQYQVFLWPLLFQKKTYPLLFLNLMVLITSVSFNFLLIPKLGIYGAIISMIITGFVQVILFYQYQQKQISLSWNKWKILVFPMIIVAVTCISEIIKIQYTLTTYFTAFVFSIVSSIGIFFLYRSELKEKIKKIKNKF